jgi:hypothetical protein
MAHIFSATGNVPADTRPYRNFLKLFISGVKKEQATKIPYQQNTAGLTDKETLSAEVLMASQKVRIHHVGPDPVSRTYRKHWITTSARMTPYKMYVSLSLRL